jgi:hypothetical protein
VRAPLLAFTAAVLAFVAVPREIDRGDVEAVGRETLDIGAHGVVVLEPGARVAYAVSSRPLLGALTVDRVDVEQRAGRVLYRVDANARVAIRTRFGEVRAANASLVVDVASPLEVSRGLDRAPVRVAVFDGNAALDDGRGGPVPVHAGQVADGGGEVTRVRAPVSRDDDELLHSSTRAEGATLAELEQRLAELTALREALAARSSALRR